MRFSAIGGFVLIVLGIYGVLYSLFSFFFGFFTVGLFLIIYGYVSKKDETLPASEPHAATSQPAQLNVSTVLFCPKCGTEIGQGVTHCPQCGEKVRE